MSDATSYDKLTIDRELEKSVGFYIKGQALEIIDENSYDSKT